MNSIKKLISIIIPAFNEEGSLPELYDRLEKAVEPLVQKYDFEFLLIDNCSIDGTAELAKSFRKKNPKWKYVRFSRNFGSEASLSAGVRLCIGDAAIVLFSDLQDPPENIPNLIQGWEEGYEVVFGVYKSKDHDTFLKILLTRAFYFVLKKISQVPLIPNAGDFRIYDRKVLNVLKTLNEKNRYLRGLTQWVGFKAKSFEYDRRPRTTGKSNAPFFYLLGFSFSVMVNFSDKPLRFFTFTGIGLFFFSVGLSAFFIFNYLSGQPIPGVTTTHVLLSFILSFQSLGFGILGEYISKIYNETKDRPLFVIAESEGVSTVCHPPL